MKGVIIGNTMVVLEKVNYIRDNGDGTLRVQFTFGGWIDVNGDLSELKKVIENEQT